VSRCRWPSRRPPRLAASRRTSLGARSWGRSCIRARGPAWWWRRAWGTAFGQIAAGLAEKHGQTAFELGLSRFSRFLFAVAAVLTIFIFAINVALPRPLIDALLFSLAIAVGIAPEMMPAIVTVSLSAGSKALAAKKVLVKRLVAIEDLGNIEILFTDKTGTLTEGAITFERALGPDGGVSGRALLLGLLCNEAAVAETGAVGGNALDQALWSAGGC
jgi:P-type Mg2+ transporter